MYNRIIPIALAIVGIVGMVVPTLAAAASAASDQERYDIGHHDGAMKGGYDEQVGIYNDNCYRFPPGPHTVAYCNGYHDGYYQNWYIYKNRNLHTINVQSGQSINQKSQINCFLAICNNHISQKASQDSNINNQN